MRVFAFEQYVRFRFFFSFIEKPRTCFSKNVYMFFRKGVDVFREEVVST